MRLLLLSKKNMSVWDMARFVAHNGHQKCTCYNEIKLCGRDALTILVSNVSITIGFRPM